MKKNLPTQDNVKRLMEQTLKNILSCVGGVYYNKYKLKLERKKKNESKRIQRHRRLYKAERHREEKKNVERHNYLQSEEMR